MGYLAEKVAYLKGLAEGMKVDADTAEGKMIVKILDVLEEMSENIEGLTEEVTDNEERLDDLEDFADEVFEILYDDGHGDGCSCGHDCDCDCDRDDEDDEYDFLDDYDEDGDDPEFYEVVCPHCDEKVYFDVESCSDRCIGSVCILCEAEGANFGACIPVQ